MEDNVNTEATGADSSTSCDDSSTNSSHSSRSGGLNEGRVTSPASDGGETAIGRPSSTGAAEEDYDDDGRDFGEESRPLCVTRAPADRAGVQLECSSNGTTTALPEHSMQCAAPPLESSSHRGGPRSSSNRRTSVVNTRYDEAFRTGGMASYRSDIAAPSGAAAQRRHNAVKNAASGSRETSSIMETFGVSTKSSSSSSHVGGTQAFPGGQGAAAGRTDSEEVSEVSAEEDGQFLDAEDGGTAGLVVPSTPAAGERLADRSEVTVERRNDVCEGAQAPQQLRRLSQPLRQQQEERQQHLWQQHQRSISQQQAQQGSPQHEHQRRELPPQQQPPFVEEELLQAAEHQQQQPAQQQQLAQQRQGAELEQRQEQEQQQEPQEACEPRGHEQQNQQRRGELSGGAECEAHRVLEEGEETRALAAAEGRVGLGVNSDSTEGMRLRAEVRETTMPSTDVRGELQQQATRDDEHEEEEDAEAEGGALDKSDENSSSEEEGEDEGEAGSSSNKKSFGCQHYRRRCKVVAPCCGEAFWCRHCHNDVKCEQEKDFRKAHEIDRTAVTEVICAVCETRQGVSNQCISCKVEFGKYYCEKCKFWDDKGIKKKVYHCDLCGLCRTGGAESFFHCTTCGSCYSTDIRGSHKCVEKAMHQPCPICCENMFTSIRQVHVLKCGHTLHADCLERLKSECSGMPRLRCPLCFKSLGEYSVFWRRLDEEVARTPLPQELRRKVACTCNDCAARTEVDYHVVGACCYCYTATTAAFQLTRQVPLLQLSPC